MKNQEILNLYIDSLKKAEKYREMLEIEFTSVPGYSSLSYVYNEHFHCISVYDFQKDITYPRVNFILSPEDNSILSIENETDRDRFFYDDDLQIIEAELINQLDTPVNTFKTFLYENDINLDELSEISGLCTFELEGMFNDENTFLFDAVIDRYEADKKHKQNIQRIHNEEQNLTNMVLDVTSIGGLNLFYICDSVEPYENNISLELNPVELKKLNDDFQIYIKDSHYVSIEFQVQTRFQSGNKCELVIVSYIGVSDSSLKVNEEVQ